MRIIPVLDILDGKVVRGVAGNRKRYKPVTSSITDSVHPVQVARDLLDIHTFREIYIADLDAIEGRPDNRELVKEVSELGCQVYLDSGITGPGDIDPDYEINHLVAGTETLDSLEVLAEICQMHPSVVSSLDYKGDDLLCREESLKHMKPRELVASVCAAGVSEIIYLDLARVGTGSGVVCERVEMVIEASEVPVIVGGGIRNASDIRSLDEAGADGVLVASCVHSGELDEGDLEGLT